MYSNYTRMVNMPSPIKKNSKIVISPGQGLLLLMDIYKNEPEKLIKLKQLYLSGAEDNTSNDDIREFLEDDKLTQYHVSFDNQVINNDSSRRYFETHLAYETLILGLKDVDYDKLKNHTQQLFVHVPLDAKADVRHVLQGNPHDDDDNLLKEYGEYIKNIKSKQMFPNLGDEERDKVLLLVKSSFLGVVNAWYNRMPIDIYGTGFYSPKNNGKLMVKGQETTRNQHLGLLKGHMPLALTDIARSNTEIPYLKPSDQATFVKGRKWVKQNFSRLVQPFSNSISGTMLCQLRAHAMLQNEGKAEFCDTAHDFGLFNKLMVSAMLFNSGGHTLHEFTAPLGLRRVQHEFRNIAGFDATNLESMFLSDNGAAYDTALGDSIDYNKILLQREVLHQSLKNIAALDISAKPKSSQDIAKSVETLRDNHNSRSIYKMARMFGIGTKKNTLIQENLAFAIKQLDHGNIASAKNIVKHLKNDLIKLGKNNFWGGESQSYKLVCNIEQELQSHQNKFHHITSAYKQAVKNISQVETKTDSEEEQNNNSIRPK